MGCVCDRIVVWGYPELSITDFRFYLSFEFRVSSSDLDFLRRALIAPDEATAGDSSPRLCVDRAWPGLLLPFQRGGYCNTHSLCGVGFGNLHPHLEV